MVEKRTLYIIWYASLGTGLSGGDNILIELSRRWADKIHTITMTGKEGALASKKKNIPTSHFVICPSFTPFRYLERMFWALWTAFTWKDRNCIIYTASDFWHDFVVGLIVKLKFPSVKWVAGYYLVAPPPFRKDTPYKKWARIRGIGYWLSQRPTLYLVNKFADKIFITSEPDRKYFSKPTVVIKGGVNIPDYKNDYHKISHWSVVFMGRLHYQKGIKELVEIWKIVEKNITFARLCIIGDGKLSRLIPAGASWFKFASDSTKDSIFRHSKVIVHPATYDSGGMSCAEGMAYGLPAVGFDLPVFKTYYPKGMLKARNIEEFAQHIVDLLTDNKLYNRISEEARDLTIKEWSWDKKAETILRELL